MATLTLPFIIDSRVQESKTTTYRGYFSDLLFSSVQRFHHAAPILFTKTVCDCRLVQPRSMLHPLELTLFNQRFRSNSSTRNVSTQSEQKGKATGLAPKRQRWDETWKGQRQ
jgi:hypothetical protein